jgi:hypothetical protein
MVKFFGGERYYLPCPPPPPPEWPPPPPKEPELCEELDIALLELLAELNPPEE